MSDMIRCNACRGTKRLEGLGGIRKDCNLCQGSGKIKASDKVAILEVEKEEVKDSAIIEKTERAIAVSELETDVIVNKKRAIYKRKRG